MRSEVFNSLKEPRKVTAPVLCSAGSKQVQAPCANGSVKKFADIDQLPISRQWLSYVELSVERHAKPTNGDDEAFDRVESDDKVSACEHQFHVAIREQRLTNCARYAKGLAVRRIVEVGESCRELRRGEQRASPR